jgi:hypothetical protein
MDEVVAPVAIALSRQPRAVATEFPLFSDPRM